MLKQTIIALSLAIGLVGMCGAGVTNVPNSSASEAALAEEAWQKEFDEACSRAQDAMTLSQEELTVLIQRCDALMPKLAKLDGTQKRVYMGRLRMCRGLYAYVLDSKKNEKQ